MQSLSHPLPLPSLSSKFHTKSLSKTSRFRLSCSSSPPPPLVKDEKLGARTEYKPNWVDDFFLKSFRNKLAEEVGWDSEKADYDGLIELANGLLVGRTNRQATEAAVRILRSLFPPFLLELFRMLITPIGGGRIAALMVARVTALTCQWLMGPCSVNSINLPDGSSTQTGVFVERCKYLEESKCVGVCVNTCKLPTQAFFKDHMGIPLLMEPNFSDYSCQFSFGILPPLPENDSTLKESCLEICPNAPRRRKDVTTLLKPQNCPRT